MALVASAVAAADYAADVEAAKTDGPPADAGRLQELGDRAVFGAAVGWGALGCAAALGVAAGVAALNTNWQPVEEGP
jgi:hypothetical protein